MGGWVQIASYKCFYYSIEEEGVYAVHNGPLKTFSTYEEKEEHL